MADITMCEDHVCKKNKTCYRYNATPDLYQSYFRESPRKGNKCEMYWAEKARMKKFCKKHP